MLDLGKLRFLNVTVFLCLKLQEVPYVPAFPEVLGFSFVFFFSYFVLGLAKHLSLAQHDLIFQKFVD